MAICFEYEFDNKNIKPEWGHEQLWNEEIYEYQWARNLDWNFSEIKDIILNLS